MTSRGRASAIDGDEIVALALELARRPSPAGDEGPLAAWLCGWLEAAGLRVRMQRFAPRRANVLVGPETGPAVAIYGHLDTSLSGDLHVDGPLTGRRDPLPPPGVVNGVLYGQGIGVAKAPTAAALVALLASRRALMSAGDAAAAGELGALVVAGGTHRSTPPWPAVEAAAAGTGPDMGVGVRAALEAGFRPGAVISCKGGAPGPLHEEPGTLYLAVEVRERYGAALARPLTDALAGSPAGLASLLEAITTWRAQHLARRVGRGGQLGADVALGAVAAGLPAKPDLLPATAAAYLSVVTLPGDDDSEIAASLRDHLRARDAAFDVSVEVYGRLPPGRTDPEHPLVRAVESAWTSGGARSGLAAISGWRGSTDGALLRAEGVPTVRLGPLLRSHPDDPRLEGVAVDDLVAVARVWAEAMVAYVTSKDTIARSATSGLNRSATNLSWRSLER